MKVAAILAVVTLATVSSLGAVGTPTTTTLSSSLNPSAYGQPVTFTAVVSSPLGPPPDGEIVTFQQGSKVLGTAPLSSGVAALTLSTLAVSVNDKVKAIYPGDSNFAGSTSNIVSQVVTQATTTTTVASSENPSNAGQSVTFTATVVPEYSGTVTGTVTFTNGGSKLGSGTLSGGVATYTTAKLSAGSDTISAVYNGSLSFSSSSSALTQTVGSGTYVQGSLTWDGIARYYQVFAPTVLPPNPPMLIMLHGTRYSGSFNPVAITSIEWNWESVANLYGFIVVQPASTWDPQTRQWNWNGYFMDAAFPAPPPDDSGFLRQLIVNLSAQYNVDPNNIFVTGMSSGAQMTERVGVEISDLVAAIAPASGQLVAQNPPPPQLPGPALAPISVQEWHGTLDHNLWPCNYGTTRYSGVTFTLDTVDDTFNYWVQQNACSTLQTTATLCLNGQPNNANDAPTPGIPGSTGNIATGCSVSNVEVQFIWEPNIGHSWQSQNNTTRWQFFSAHPKQ